MPCSKNMTGCRRGCLHRQTVSEYHAAREAAEQTRENITRGWSTETAEYGRIIDFRSWLVQMKRS